MYETDVSTWFVIKIVIDWSVAGSIIQNDAKFMVMHTLWRPPWLDYAEALRDNETSCAYYTFHSNNHHG